MGLLLQLSLKLVLFFLCAPLFAYLHCAQGQKGGADSILRYHFHLISNFYMLFFIKSAPCRLSPIEALPQTPQWALPLDPTSPLAPGLSVRFISRFARCLGAALLIPHSSLNSTPHLSSYCILILFKQSTLLGVEQLVNDIANSRSVQPTSLQKSIAFISISEITNIDF